jgi:hypothetical protein
MDIIYQRKNDPNYCLRCIYCLCCSDSFIHLLPKYDSDRMPKCDSDRMPKCDSDRQPNLYTYQNTHMCPILYPYNDTISISNLFKAYALSNSETHDSHFTAYLPTDQSYIPTNFESNQSNLAAVISTFCRSNTSTNWTAN